MTPEEWDGFWAMLPAELRALVDHKRRQQQEPTYSDEAISKALGWTPKKVNRNWSKLLKLAWQHRNQSSGGNQADD